MPPKKPVKVNNNKYVLIWWIIDGKKTITELSKLPKGKREKNSTVKLKWGDKEGKKKFYFAKIIEFGASIDYLENIRLDNKGNICDDSIKMFPEAVFEQKKSHEISKKITNEFEKKNNTNIERKIIQQKPIFAIDHPPLSEHPKEKVHIFKPEKILKKTSDEQNNALVPILPNFKEDFNNKKSIDEGVDLSSIWDSEYFKNWTMQNNHNFHISNSQLPSFHQPIDMLSTDVLEIGCLGKKVYQSDQRLSCPSVSLAHENTCKNLTLFRPWDSLSTTDITTPSTSNASNFPVQESTISPEIESNVNEFTNSRPEEFNVGSLPIFLKNEVRETDLEFIRMLEQSIIKAYESYERYDRQSSKIFSIPEFYMQPGKQMVEIAPGSKIYFPIHVKNQIEKAYEERGNNNGWESIVKLSLKEVYGDNISNYSAKGKLVSGFVVGGHPQIDARLYNAIFDWVRVKVGSRQIINAKLFNKAINKYCCNKRSRKNDQTKQSDQPDWITENNVQFFKKIVKNVEESYNIQQKNMLPERQTHQLSNVYTEPAKIKNKISPNYEIYLPKTTCMYIERKSEIARGKYDWHILVKETLMEIYGDTLTLYSAKGTRGGFPGINAELYRALYDWSCTVTDEIISDAEYMETINTFIANRRKWEKKKIKSMSCNQIVDN